MQQENVTYDLDPNSSRQSLSLSQDKVEHYSRVQ